MSVLSDALTAAGIDWAWSPSPLDERVALWVRMDGHPLGLLTMTGYQVLVLREKIPTGAPFAGRPFRKGDKVTVVLRGAGGESREPGIVARASKGIAFVDNGPGNDEDPYDAKTGRYARDSFGGFSRWIEPS